MPSIQLAVLEQLLGQYDVESCKFEFYLDLCGALRPENYKYLDNFNFVLAERLFAPHYFNDSPLFEQTGEESIRLSSLPPESEEACLKNLPPVIEAFMRRCKHEEDWAAFDAFLFSLTTAQTTASLALAKHLKKEFPAKPIVFGGTSCAGEMGVALMEVAPEIDVVVHSEAENCLGPLVDALKGLVPFSTVPGISYRDRGTIVTTEPAPLFETNRGAMQLDFSSYFDRLSRHSSLQEVSPWIPFETSRGCWYGEKSHCTFCGLNEIIKYREKPASGLIDTLEGYQRDYECTQFYAVDLIMPRGFEKTVFPEITRRGHDWTIFFEIKSNMKHEDVVALRRGGVKSIQPGIESLDDDVLRMMRKGVTAAQNVQMLRWARELGMSVDWNILVGFPGESPQHYLNQIDLLPSLFHLTPPTGIGRFELHRFSPYFDQPEEHGLRILGADPRYRAVFPLEPDLLDRLVYRFAFEHTAPQDERLEALTDELQDLGEDWWSAKRAGVRFDYCPRDDGSAELIDTRMGRSLEVPLAPSDSALFDFLREKRIRRSASLAFAKTHPKHADRLGGRSGVEARLETWLAERYLLEVSGYVQSLALRRDERQAEEPADLRSSADKGVALSA